MFFFTCSITLFAQQRIDIIDNGSKSDKGVYYIKEVDGNMRTSALVVIQSTEKLEYATNKFIPHFEAETTHSVDSDGIHEYKLHFYANEVMSKGILTLFAQGFPSENIKLDLKPNTTYSYIIIAPEVIAQEESSDVDIDQLREAAAQAMEQLQFEYAEKLYGKLAEREQTDTAFANLADAQFKQAKLGNKFYLKAIASANKALSINPDNSMATLIAGVSYAKEASIMSFGNEVEYSVKAVEHLFKAIQSNVDDFEYYELAADTYNRLFTALVLKNLRNPNSDKYKYYYSLIDFDRGIVRYKNLNLKDLNFSLYKFANNQMVYYQREIKRNPSPKLYLKLGDACVLMNKFDEAIECFEKSITSYDKTGESRIRRVKNRTTK